MEFKLAELALPDFSKEEFTKAENIKTCPAEADGIAPVSYTHLTLPTTPYV